MFSTPVRLFAGLGWLVSCGVTVLGAESAAGKVETFQPRLEFRVQHGDLATELDQTETTPAGSLADRLAAVSVEELAGALGARFPFTGRDIRAVTPGPDGRLYFFCAAGAALGAPGLELPEEGAVVRCEADGSHPEVFCRGLRDPHGLAFDNLGNLFAADTGSGRDDQGRWMYLMEQGDYGWRAGWPRSALPPALVPWMAEGLWAALFGPQADLLHSGKSHDFDYRAAWVLPPIANVSAGVWGVAHYPGTGFGDRFDDHFFMSNPLRRAIQFWNMRVNGAGFLLLDQQDAGTGAAVRELAFLPGAKLGFVAYDVEEGKEQSEFYVLHASGDVPDPQEDEVKRLLGGELKQKGPIEWQGLLKHPDQRVRLAAEWRLTTAPDGEMFLRDVALSPNGGAQPSIARLHGIWGLGMLARRAEEKTPGTGSRIVEPLVRLLEDDDLEVRAQAARVLGDLRVSAAFDGLIKTLRNPDERVSMMAAEALGKLGNREALPQLILMLREAGDHDPNQRHAYVEALLGLHDFSAIEEAARNSSPAVRLAALLAMRRLRRGEITLFLQDEDPALVGEALRAVHDENITAGIAPLAASIAHPNEPLLPRVLNANFRLGTAEGAQALAEFAAREEAPEALRVEALQLLADWPAPPKFDYVTGAPQDLAARDPAPARAALEAVLPKLESAKGNGIREALAEARKRLEK